MIVALIASCVCCASPADRLLNAIEQVESGGRDVIGDGGRSIGPYQIQRAYWQDARVPGRYEDCHGREYSRRVVRAYWRRYAKNGSLETLARIHNGGPAGHKKNATLKYWARVRKAMK